LHILNTENLAAPHMKDVAMSRQAFEYHTEFAPLNYLVRTKKLFMFKSEEPLPNLTFKVSCRIRNTSSALLS
jgi:hypothetical protein